MKDIREPRVAGMFYPLDPTELEYKIKGFLNDVEIDTTFEKVVGLVSPHAGYDYSGKTAAYGYKTIENKKYKNVIILSPSHREYFRGISIYSGDAYKTPLGTIPVNKEIREKLVSESEIIFEGLEGHKAEHALEVQLPFLQVMLQDFQLLPIVIGDQSIEFIYDLVDSLVKNIDDNTLLVASSDLSHFYSKAHAKVLDQVVINHINEYKFDELQEDLEKQRCEACGGGAIVAIMRALNEKNISNSKVLAYTDSGEMTGDNSEVVGYLSAVIYK